MRTAEISLPAIRHNVRQIKGITGGMLIAVIKANGYGHGAEIVAGAALAGGADLLAVTDLEEALQLRDRGVTAPILSWLHGARADFDAAVAQNIEIGVSNMEQLERLAEVARGQRHTATIQFKVDTGLSRNGLGEAEWETAFSRAAALEAEGVIRVRGIFSHLANAGRENDLAQGVCFDRAVAQLRAAGCEPELIHLAASAATFLRPELRYNTVRVGMAIYGLSPFADKSSAELGLCPAMTLKSEVVYLRQVPEGSGVSYGFNHVVQRDTTLALVPIGYADGMPRALNGAGATVVIAGQQCPIVGRIGMDQCIIDLGNLGKRVSVGDQVILFGDPLTGVPPVEVWAELMHTINYEMVVSIGTRVVRVAVEGPDLVVPCPEPESLASEPEAGNHVTERFTLSDPDHTHDFGVRLGKRLKAGDLVILTGPLGAGKTTLTRGLGEGLSVRGPVTSPTFVLARTHPSLIGGAPLVHVDAYRLQDALELDDLDLDFERSVVVAEWGAGLVETRESWLEIVIERPTGAGTALAAITGTGADAETDDWETPLVEPRILTVNGYGPRWAGGIW